MKEVYLSNQQSQFVIHAQKKVAALFDTYPVIAHGYDHIARVSRWAEEIAIAEAPKDLFLAVLSGWFHDIGRAIEKYNNPEKKRHHELSYILLKEWMLDDPAFEILSDEQRIELLYAVRYHWNNFADDYNSAIILRDADKIDMFGTIGLQRSIEWNEGNEAKIDLDLRLRYDSLYYLRSPYAQKVIKDNHMLDPINDYYEKLLRDKIEPITLT